MVSESESLRARVGQEVTFRAGPLGDKAFRARIYHVGAVADPLVGLAITAAILLIVWQSASAVFTRMLDGVEPHVIDELSHAALHVKDVQSVSEVRARWIGHRLHAEVNITVAPTIRVAEAHGIAKEVHHQLLHHLPYLAKATIHVDPLEEAGEGHHRVTSHAHDGLPVHSH